MRTVAAINLPVSGPNGEGLENWHAVAAADLREAFGRVRTFERLDSWRDEETGLIYRESCVSYFVGAETWTPKLTDKLDRIAAHFARKSGHAFVSVTHADGCETLNSPASPNGRAVADLDEWEAA